MIKMASRSIEIYGNLYFTQHLDGEFFFKFTFYLIVKMDIFQIKYYITLTFVPSLTFLKISGSVKQR